MKIAFQRNQFFFSKKPKMKWQHLVFGAVVFGALGKTQEELQWLALMYGGAWKGPHAEHNVLQAVAQGYRAFDTANVYAASYNETAVGEKISLSKRNSPLVSPKTPRRNAPMGRGTQQRVCLTNRRTSQPKSNRARRRHSPTFAWIS